MPQSSPARLMIALCGDLSLTAEDEKHLKHPAVGGVILFSRNFASGEQLRQLTAAVRRAAGRPLLIATDQEGGRVQRFCGGEFFRLPPMAELAAVGSLPLLRAAGTVMAAELLAVGVDLSFAPVLDLAHGRSQIIGSRAFGAVGEAAAEAALAFAGGMRAAGMAACGKHFPGHGYALADSHQALPTDARKFADIAAADLIPFARWAQNDMPALMTAHIVYEQCDPAAATFSSYWLRTVLRKKLCYRGMIVSDDLTMVGADIGDMQTRMQAATDAGCDGLLVCQPAAVTAALATATGGTDNPWLALSAQADRQCVGDAAVARAKIDLQKFMNRDTADRK